MGAVTHAGSLRRALAAMAFGAAAAVASAAGEPPPAGAAPARPAAVALPDPMRPSGMAAPAATGAGRSERPSAPVHLPRLQSVLLGQGGARAAVIDGVVLAVGDRLGDARLFNLTERSAVLVGPQGRKTTLLLIPGVDRQDVATTPRPADASPPEPYPRPASLRAWRATENSR